SPPSRSRRTRPMPAKTATTAASNADTVAPLVERWIYAGRRLGKTKPFDAWLDPNGEERYFATVRGRKFAVGSVYEVSVTRFGENVTMHGVPSFTDELAGKAQRDRLIAEHAIATTRIDSDRMEKRL